MWEKQMKSLHWLSQHCLRIAQPLGVLTLVGLATASCTAADVLSALNPLDNGGVNANANIGKDVVQGVRVDASSAAPTTSVAPNARVDSINQSTNNYVEMPPWVLLVIVCLAAGGAIGWVDNIMRLFRRKPDA